MSAHMPAAQDDDDLASALRIARLLRDRYCGRGGLLARVVDVRHGLVVDPSPIVDELGDYAQYVHELGRMTGEDALCAWAQRQVTGALRLTQRRNGLVHALAHIRGLQSSGVAATAKHWPGEGHDDRDQHLVTTINPLSVADWHATHGVLYRAAIDAGVMAVMSAHIAFPDYVLAHDPEAEIETVEPPAQQAREPIL